MARRVKATKFKTIKYEVLNEEVSFDIKVMPDGTFTTSWPERMREILGSWHVTMESLSDLETEILTRVKQVNDAETTVEWILAYRFKSRTWVKHSNPHSEFSLAFTPFKKTTVGSKVTYNYVTYDTFRHMERTDRGRHEQAGPLDDWYVLTNTWDDWRKKDDEADPTNDNILPLTRENLDFFIQIAEKVELLSDKLHEYLDPDNIQKSIASNVGLLLTSGESPKGETE